MTVRPGASETFLLQLRDGRTLELVSGSVLSPTDLPGVHSVPPGSAVAVVRPHPTDPAIFGLQNLSHLPWKVQLPNGDRVDVKPGKNVRLAAGTRVDFGSIDGEIQYGHGVTPGKSRVWIVLLAAAVVVGALAFAGWHFERRLAAEQLRRQQVVREAEQQLQQAERAAKLKRDQEAAAAAEQREQKEHEEARARALAEAASPTPPPTPTPSREFDGTWIADHPSFGFLYPDGKNDQNAKKVRLGSYRATLVIENGERASFVVEFHWRLAPGSDSWFDMPAPYNKTTPRRYQKYNTTALEMSSNGSALSISWDTWQLTGWGPKTVPKWAIGTTFKDELPVPKMTFRLTGPNELTSADLVFHRVR